MRKRSLACFLTALALATSNSWAQVDSIQNLISQLTVSGGTPSSPGLLFASAYDPNSDVAYVSLVTPAAPTDRIRRIRNLTTSPTIETVFNTTQLDAWLQQGTNRTGSGLPQGLTFNPVAVGSIGAFGSLWFSDTATVSLPGTSENDPAASQRIYRYNLQSVPTSGATLYANMSQVLTPVAAKSHKQIAAGQAPSAASDSSGRQAVFSPNGQSLYLLDNGSASAIPGIYRIDPLNPGNVTRVTGATVGMAVEPGVSRIGNLDRIYYRSSNNPGALSSIDFDPSTNTASAETVVLSATQLQEFLQTAATPSISSISTGSNGNVYFCDSATGVMLQLDSAGRLAKVTTRAERATVLNVPASGTGAPSTSMVKMQVYAYSHPTAGAITRVFYNELVYGLSAVNIFKVGDFDRNGVVNAIDTGLFATKLSLIGEPSTIADARFDMNGNGSIDYKDVKILQGFVGFADGDVTLDLKVDFDDLLALAQNYGNTSAKWTTGDFTGDQVVNFDDLLALAQNYGSQLQVEDAARLPTNIASDFALARSLVPEPALAIFGAATLAILGNRSTRRNGSRVPNHLPQ